MSTITAQHKQPSSAELWEEFDAIEPHTAVDKKCPACGHGKSMHMSYGGCSYTEVNGQNCPCTTRRSDI